MFSTTFELMLDDKMQVFRMTNWQNSFITVVDCFQVLSKQVYMFVARVFIGFVILNMQSLLRVKMTSNFSNSAYFKSYLTFKSISQ